jgi:signal transduction histidine kinase/CheY-like chemotaxis protein
VPSGRAPPHSTNRRGFAISLAFLIYIVAVVGIAAVVVVRWRRAAQAGAQRSRDAAAIAQAREAVQAPAASAGELAFTQAALAESRSALAAAQAEAAQAREEARAARRLRHSFIAGLAHDLRNPLAPLSNGIELLRLTDEDAEGRRRTRGIMERQIGNLMRIADELSDLARLTAGQPALQRLPCQVVPLLEAVATASRPGLQAHDMTLETVVDPPGPLPMLQGDAQRLEQGLSHLVRDLVRHSERGTSLRLVARSDGTSVTLVLAASDDLQPGSTQAGAPRHEEADAGALGLGVSLCEQIVALHGGRLQVQRPTGARRAIFAITLPVTPPATGAGKRETGNTGAVLSLSPEPSLAVLIADDNVEFSTSFGTMLELLGHRVEVVHDGLAAVAYVASAPPDIAFIDIGMPSLDGFDAVQRVRRQANGKAVLLVAITGRGGAEDRARAAECGFDRYLVKPFAMQDVRDALDAAQAARAPDGSPMVGSVVSSRELA